MTSPQSPNDFLMGGGGKSAKFDTPGDTISGVITAEPQLRQQTDIKDSKPKFWDNGDPMMQLVVKLQTELREDHDDDGVRAVYIKGGFKAPTMQKAVADAVRAAGAQGLAVGGTLTIRYTGEGPKSTGMNPPKYYIAKYELPVAGAAFLSDGQAADPWATPAAAPPAPAAAPQPAQQNGWSQQPAPDPWAQQQLAAAPAPPAAYAPPAATSPPPPAPAASNGHAGAGMVTLPDGSVVTAEIAALLQQVGGGSA